MSAIDLCKILSDFPITFLFKRYRKMTDLLAIGRCGFSKYQFILYCQGVWKIFELCFNFVTFCINY